MVWVSYHVRSDESVVPNMSGEGKLQRSSWKAEAIRRGDLKISGPIPITEETPLNDEEEREYAERHNIESAAPMPDSSSQQAEAQQPQPPPPQSSVNDESLHIASDQIEEQPQVQESHHTLRHKRSSSGIRETSEMQRNTPEPVSYGSPSPFPSIPDTPSKTTPKKKRKSGLRNVFRKMFSRRSREEHSEQETVHKHGYHRSDPGLLTQSPENPKENGPRISDMPVREIEPINPLGQHLPFPMNVNAPQETSPPHEYLTFQVPPNLNRRRATLPSVLLSQAEASALSSAWGKQASSWDERQDAESIPSPLIGIALSSPTPPYMPTHVKRRSRSAGALRELAKNLPSTERRRSAEIRYWRSSYQSGSVYSTNTPRPRTAQTVETVETIRTADTRDTAANAPEESIAESSTADVPTIAQHDQDLSQIELPVESFNFGNLRSEFSDDETHDPQQFKLPPRSEKRVSIEDRVKHLEDNMCNLETTVRRLSGRSNRQTIILENVPKGRRSRNRSTSATSERQFSRQSSKSSNRSLSIKHEDSEPPSPTHVPLSVVDEFPNSPDRPQTMIALEPSAIPRPTTTPHDSSTTEQFAAVYAALDNERAARRTLERQVVNLQREVSDLHGLVNKFVSTSPSYPTPSPDAIISSNEERLSTPRASGRPTRSLKFESDEEGIPSTSRKIRETIVSRFSRTDSEGGGEVARSLGSSKEDITSPDVWATPKEESGGFFARSRVDVTEKGDDDDEMF
ncbi:uncharacterized protein BDR25DRAFT_37295 [Lindgomyces ingoldianus]|uniref:Uncharacterized protein n=1 Tax=Lindgomyces ingoldianus TaxID=673940 RepID=A0ACB6QT08_9PLEO|nr:uncharacterized protein BDR25DRAFT_37295 [Lindgomyces ingoldianus]KAF2470148.1 hypothetical protein BDR25DRAFT_37295 [Lindgomyces ingoldianus]